jgi:sulfur-carrier protein
MPDVSQDGSKAPVVKVQLPTAFHVLTGGRKQVTSEGDTVREVLVGLEKSFPGVVDRLMDAQGAMKRYVNVYRNDSDIRSLDGLETKLAGDDVLWIIPAVAGGSGTARA